MARSPRGRAGVLLVRCCVSFRVMCARRLFFSGRIGLLFVLSLVRFAEPFREEEEIEETNVLSLFVFGSILLNSDDDSRESCADVLFSALFFFFNFSIIGTR